MNRATVFGAPYSIYVRIVRLVLEEIGVPYDLVEIDIFSKETVPADYADRHPFGRIPAFEHDGFRLFETDAIVGYVVDSFDGGALLPGTARERARMRQVMRIMDNYAYPSWVWGIFVEETERDRLGRRSRRRPPGPSGLGSVKICVIAPPVERKTPSLNMVK